MQKRQIYLGLNFIDKYIRKVLGAPSQVLGAAS